MTATADPTRLGKYRVLAHVAEGPIADVLSARLDGIAGFSRRFAIKRLKAELASDAELVARVEEQARRAASLSHGNIAQVLDLGRDGDRPFMVVEWVDGWDLGRILARAGEVGRSVPVAHAAWIGWQVLKALEYAHARQALAEGQSVADPFVHGSLGVEDVLVSRGGEVKVSDFGIARVADDLARARPGAPVREDRATPEQLAGQAPDVATDLYAAAAVVARALLGGSPFVADGPDGLRGAVLDGRRVDLGAARSDVSAGLLAALDAALQVDRSRRPSSLRELKQALAEASEGAGGDVFTQETLGAWLRDLFGEPERWSDASAPPLVAVDALEVDDDAPPTTPGLEGFGDDLGSLPLGSDRTEPLVARAPQPTLHDGDDDGRTAVGAVQAPVAVRAGEAPLTQAWEVDAAAAVPPELAARLAELRGPGVMSDDASLDDARPARWTTGVLVGLGLLALGMLLGALGVVGASRSEALVLAPSVLDVRPAPGVVATVTVDGAVASGAQRLAPGRHVVRVERGDAPPWQVELDLVEGEHRVLVVEGVGGAAAPSEAAAVP